MQKRVVLAVVLLGLWSGCGNAGAGGTPGGNPGSASGPGSEEVNKDAGQAGPVLTNDEAAIQAALPQASIFRVFIDLSPVIPMTGAAGCFDFSKNNSSPSYHLWFGSYYQLDSRYWAPSLFPGQVALMEWAAVDYAGQPTLLIPTLQFNSFSTLYFGDAAHHGCSDTSGSRRALTPGSLVFEGGGLPLDARGGFASTHDESAYSSCGQSISRWKESFELKTTDFSLDATAFTGQLTVGRSAIPCPFDTAERCALQAEDNRTTAAACNMTLSFRAQRVAKNP
jgi:hypothetical protein